VQVVELERERNRDNRTEEAQKPRVRRNNQWRKQDEQLQKQHHEEPAPLGEAQGRVEDQCSAK